MSSIVLFVICRRNELESKEMVAEMVYYFLLPEVEKQTIREKGIACISEYIHEIYYSIIININLFCSKTDSKETSISCP